MIFFCLNFSIKTFRIKSSEILQDFYQVTLKTIFDFFYYAKEITLYPLNFYLHFNNFLLIFIYFLYQFTIFSKKDILLFSLLMFLKLTPVQSAAIYLPQSLITASQSNILSGLAALPVKTSFNWPVKLRLPVPYECQYRKLFIFGSNNECQYLKVFILVPIMSVSI